MYLDEEVSFHSTIICATKSPQIHATSFFNQVVTDFGGELAVKLCLSKKIIGERKRVTFSVLLPKYR